METNNTNEQASEQSIPENEGFVQMIFRKGYQWPIGIVLLLMSGVVMDVVVLMLASDSQGLAVHENYYQKASSYDQTKKQLAFNEELGWKLNAQIQPMTSFKSRLLLNVIDSDGNRVVDAKVNVKVFHKARPKGALQGELEQNSDGQYELILPLRQEGAYQIDSIVEKGETKFTDTTSTSLWRK